MVIAASCDMFLSYNLFYLQMHQQILGFGWLGQVPLAMKHVSIYSLMKKHGTIAP